MTDSPSPSYWERRLTEMMPDRKWSPISETTSSRASLAITATRASSSVRSARQGMARVMLTGRGSESSVAGPSEVTLTVMASSAGTSSPASAAVATAAAIAATAVCCRCAHYRPFGGMWSRSYVRGRASVLAWFLTSMCRRLKYMGVPLALAAMPFTCPS